MPHDPYGDAIGLNLDSIADSLCEVERLICNIMDDWKRCHEMTTVRAAACSVLRIGSGPREAAAHYSLGLFLRAISSSIVPIYHHSLRRIERKRPISSNSL